MLSSSGEMKEVLIISSENEDFPTWSLREWDLESHSLIHTHAGDLCSPNGLALCSPSRVMVTSSALRPQLRMHTAGRSDGNDCSAILSFQGKIENVAYSTNLRNQMLVVSSGNALQVCELSTGWKSRNLCGHNQTVTKAIFTGNDRLIVSGGRDGLILTWDVSRILNSLDDVDPELKLANYLMPIVDFCNCGPNSPTLVWSCSMDKTCQMQFRQGHSQANVLRGHRAPVSCISVSLCGRFLASGAMDKQVRLWDISGKHCIRVITQPGAVIALGFLTYCENEPVFSPHSLRLLDATTKQAGSVISLSSVSREPHTKKIKVADFICIDENEESKMSELQGNLHDLKKKLASLLPEKLKETQC